MISRLPAAAHKRAADFLHENGTNLKRQRYAFHFECEATDRVVTAMQKYQNAGGGYGNGLEQDPRTKNSSVICTTIALQIMAEANISPASEILRQAISFLEQQYQFDNWPNISSNCNDAPHAPWWKFDEQWASTSKFLANPGAEILGYLLQYDTKLDNDTVQSLLEKAIDQLAEDDLEMHELLCYLRLCHCQALGENYHEAMLPLLLVHAFRLVKVEPSNWEEYGLTPIGLVDHPGSVFADFFEDSLNSNFAYQISLQSDEGCWKPSWSWGGDCPATWAVVETEIKAELTLKTRLQLRQFDYLGDL